MKANVPRRGLWYLNDGDASDAPPAGGRGVRRRARRACPLVLVIGIAGFTPLAGCQRAPEATAEGVALRPLVGSPKPTRPVEQLTPELIEMSQRILEANGDAPIGEQFSFEMNGQSYVARIEEHEDATRGPHKGVTLYHADSALGPAPSTDL